MAARIPPSVIDEINRKTDILEVIGQYVKLSPKGNNWWGLCPFHSEKTPSFSVNPESNLYFCFGCQKGGSVFQFLMETDSLSFPEAVRALADKAGVAIPDGDWNVADDSFRQKKALEELYRRVSGTFHWLLLNHPHATVAREYLEARGILPETRDAFLLGWAPDDGYWLYRFLRERDFSPEFLAQSGLFVRKNPRSCN